MHSPKCRHQSPWWSTQLWWRGLLGCWRSLCRTRDPPFYHLRLNTLCWTWSLILLTSNTMQPTFDLSLLLQFLKIHLNLYINMTKGLKSNTALVEDRCTGRIRVVSVKWELWPAVTLGRFSSLFIRVIINGEPVSVVHFYWISHILHAKMQTCITCGPLVSLCVLTIQTLTSQVCHQKSVKSSPKHM